MGTTRDALWVVVTAVAVVMGVNVVVASLWRAVTDGAWVTLLLAPLGVLLWTWVGLGAWRRTSWGRPGQS